MSTERDPARIASVLDAIRRAWVEQPDTRLGQLILNACHDENGRPLDLFYIEDDELALRLVVLESLRRKAACNRAASKK